MQEHELTREEAEYLDTCKAVYNELKDTKLYDYLIKLREKIIHRIANSETDRDAHINIGSLKIIDDLIDKRISAFNEIKRIESIAK